MDDPWPTGIPLSLWTYNQLRAEELVQIPMMGIRFAPGFLYAFAFGCVFVALFAWKRFSIQSDVKSVSRALGELSPSDIGGRGALIRAYFIYAGAILLLYVSLTFFGRLLLQTANMVPVVGIQVDLNKLQFDSAQWPLMLAFAFAGLAEMLPPVRMTEGWLRDRAYRAVGIPVRLEQTMRNLIVTLDGACAIDAESTRDPLVRRLKTYRDRWAKALDNNAWARDQGTQRQSRKDEAVSLLAQLELLVYWAKSARGSWPGHEVSRSVRQQERKYVDEAVALLDEINKRMFEAQHDTSDAETPARKARFSDYLGETIRKAELLRFDLVGILAIFLERDLDIPAPRLSAAHPEQAVYIEPALHKLLTRTERPDTAGTGPEAGLFLALIAVFLVYAAATWRGVQEPIGQFVENTNLSGVLVTALVETLRIAALTWLPLLAAFSLRQFMWDNGDWAKATRTQRRSGYAMQIFACLCLGGTVSLLALLGVAALRAFFVASNATYFFSLYLDGLAPLLMYYATQIVILLVLIPVSLMSADLREGAATRLWYGVLCAVGVGVLSILHLHYWNPTLAAQCPGLTVIATLDCARRVGLIDLVVLTLLAFLAAGVFGELPERARLIRPSWTPRAAGAAVLVILSSIPTVAQTNPPRPVYVGFRADTPPFSSAVALTLSPDASNAAGMRPYRGYLADICFDIFAGQPDYRIVPVLISAGDRFIRLRRDLPARPADFIGPFKPLDPSSPGLIAFGIPSDPQHLDMLCDAVTMRFSDVERAEHSVFSPVVFASGVSFLDRTRSSGDLIVGYVENSTARDVARKICEIDYFKALLPTQRGELYRRCKLRWSAAALAEQLQRIEHAAGTRPAGEMRLRPDMFDHMFGTLLSERRAQLERGWDELFDAGARLKEATGSRIEQIAVETRALLNNVVATPERPSPVGPLMEGCLNNNDQEACRKTLKMLADPMCSSGAAPATANNMPVEKRPWPDYHFCPMQSHDALIDWFCTAPFNQRRIYMGDRELILGKMETWTKANGPCSVERPDGAEYLSYEPYAFPISLHDPKLIQFVQRRVYEIFSHRAEMNSRFAANFPGREMSHALAYLFLLNAVENEGTLGPWPPLTGQR